jgi:hypothetical protein
MLTIARREQGRRQAFKAAKERLAARAGRGEEPQVAECGSSAATAGVRHRVRRSADRGLRDVDVGDECPSGRIAERDDVAVDVVASHQAAPAIANTPTPSDRPQRPW